MRKLIQFIVVMAVLVSFALGFHAVLDVVVVANHGGGCTERVGWNGRSAGCTFAWDPKLDLGEDRIRPMMVGWNG